MALAAAACAGPTPPLEVGIKEYPTDVVLGALKRAATPAPMPPVALNVPPSFFGPRLPVEDGVTTTTRVTRPAPPCAEDDPLVPVKAMAEVRATVPPAQAEYPFRTVGEFRSSGANAAQGTYPGQSTRAVTNVVQSDDGSYTFDVTATLGDQVTTTGYRVVPTGPAPGRAGVFITKVVDNGRAFTPAPEMLLLQFPAELGTFWKVNAVDPVTQQTMSYNAAIDRKMRVNACGTPVEAWQVRIDGQLVFSCTPAEFGPPATTIRPERQTCVDLDAGGAQAGQESVVSFTATYGIATQFGGISVYDKVETVAREPQVTVSKQLESTINREPARARAAR